MAKVATCPKCEKQFSLPEIEGTATIACPFCQTHITLKSKPVAPPPAIVVSAAAPVISIDDDDDDYDDKRPRKKKKKKRSASSSGGNDMGMKIAIVLGLLALAGGAIGLMFWFFLSQGGGGSSRPKVEMPTNPVRMEDPNNGAGGGGNSSKSEAPPEEKMEKDRDRLASLELKDRDMVPSKYMTRLTPDTPLHGLDSSPLENRTQESLTPEILKRSKKSTVFIEVEKRGSGSGFFALEKGIVITNAHVIGKLDDSSDEMNNPVNVYVDYGLKSQKKYRASVLKIDRRNDLAMLRLPREKNEEYPPPMKIASSEILQETQKAYALGFPYGGDDGKEVTLTQLSVSSLHRDSNKRVNSVRFSGAGLNPGNSGGPIVDTQGRVISVAVRIKIGMTNSGEAMENTGISFGVPSEEIIALRHGRADTIDVFSPVRHGDQLAMTVRMSLDSYVPRQYVSKIMVEIGDEGKAPARPTSGESTHLKDVREAGWLALKSNFFRRSFGNTITLPPLKEGKVYWLFPQLCDESDDSQTRWIAPVSYKPDFVISSEPLTKAGSPALPKRFNINYRSRWRVSYQDSERSSYYMQSESKSLWAVENSTLTNMDFGAKIDDRTLPMDRLEDWWSLNHNKGARTGSVKQEAYWKPVLEGWVDISHLRIPDGEISPGTKWNGSDFQPGFEYVSGIEKGTQSSCQCEYLGTYEKGSKKLGIIRLTGKFREAPIEGESTPGDVVGIWEGFALVDAANRSVTDISMRTRLTKRATQRGAFNFSNFPKLDGLVELRLKASS